MYIYKIYIFSTTYLAHAATHAALTFSCDVISELN